MQPTAMYPGYSNYNAIPPCLTQNIKTAFTIEHTSPTFTCSIVLANLHSPSYNAVAPCLEDLPPMKSLLDPR